MKKTFTLLLIGLMAIACGKDDSYDPVIVDTQAPSKPLNLVVSNQTQTSLMLNWEAATDNVSVSGYRIYQNGTALVGLVSETSATIQNLTAGTAYSFYITALDAEENEGQ